MRLQSLTFKLLGISTGTLVVMFLACLYMFMLGSDKQKLAANAELFSLTYDISQRLGKHFSERYEAIKIYADNSVFQGKQTEEMMRALNKYVGLSKSYELIVYVDLTGKVLAVNNLDNQRNPIDVTQLQNHNFANAPWFLNTVNEKFTEDSSKGLVEVYFEDFMIDPLTAMVFKNKSIGTSFSTPVRDDKGKMIGVLSSRTNTSWVDAEFISLYKRIEDKTYGTLEMTLLNSKGEVVVDYDPSVQKLTDKVAYDLEKVALKLNLADAGNPAVLASLKGESGTATSMHSRRQKLQATAYTPVVGDYMPGSVKWLLLLRIDEQALFGKIQTANTMFFVVCGIVLAGCLLFSGIFALHLSRRLKTISEKILEAGHSVDTVSQQLSNASQDLSSGATEVASSLEETVSSLEELTSMVKTNADNAGESASLAQNSSKVAKEGEAEVQSLISAISDINESSKKIEEIINVIDDIAFQTNLLALNAAVEAARAGDQGRGFAVVAEALRNLAQRSGTAAKEITSLIRDNVEKIDRGTKIADRSGQVLQSILSSVRKVADLNNEIAAASKEQASGLSQISKAMNEIDQATQRNAAASEEVASSSEEMNAQAAGLQNMVEELSSVVTGIKGNSEGPSNLLRPAAPAKKAKASPKVSHLKGMQVQSRGPGVKVKDLKSARSSAPVKSHAESIIPFGDEENDEPPAKISSTAGF